MSCIISVPVITNSIQIKRLAQHSQLKCDNQSNVKVDAMMLKSRIEEAFIVKTLTSNLYKVFYYDSFLHFWG